MKMCRPEAAKIKALRVQKSWPQEQLAQIAEVSPRTIQRVEAGSNASYETLRSIASAFDVEITDLLMEQPLVSSIGCPEDTAAEESPREAQSLQSLARSNRKLKIMSSILSGGLLILTCYLGVARFWSRPTVSEKTTLGQDVPQAPAGIFHGFENLPASGGGHSPEDKSQVKIRPGTHKNKQFSQRTYLQELRSSSVAPLEVPLPDLVLPGHLAGIHPAIPEMIDSFRVAPESAAAPAGEVTAESSDAVPEIEKVNSLASEGLSSRVKHAATGGALSTSDAVQQSSKRIAGFFTRLGTTVKKSL